MEDLAESLSKDKIKSIHCSPLVHGAGHLITEGNKVGQMSYAFDKAILALPNHCLVLYVPGNGSITFPTLASLDFPGSSQDNTCLS